jgi:enoyl-CoA hydratase/carnithine racemase
MIAGCTGALRGGILYLTLDTRGSSVNVFTPAVALELERELQAGLAAGARAVVLQSGKPGSFVNGVGLLLAASSHAQGAAMERAHGLRRCYERLAAAPVPTIAAIEGNCYGCGLELALACDYRIARDNYDTQFYMPEVRDYAFVPLFGATQRLPRLVGLRAAMELLLGQRLDARRAARVGLVDRLAPADGVAGTLRSLLSTLRAQRWPKRPPRRRASSGAPAIDGVPGPERGLARECLRLARLPFEPGYRLEDGLREELASFWKTLGMKESERAMSFFFVRQAAKAHAIGSAAYQRPARLAIAVERRTPALRKLARTLEQRRLAGVEVGRRGTIAFAAATVPGALTCTLGGPRTEADCAAFLPFAGGGPIELVPAAPQLPWRRGADLFQVLEQAGFQPVVTRARERFVSERLLAAFASAIGGRPARASLLDFGYRLPAALLRRVRPGDTDGIAAQAANALALECIRALDEGELTHPSQADLLADILFGFPVVHGGLLRYVASGTGPMASAAARVLGKLPKHGRRAALRAPAATLRTRAGGP